MASLRTLFRSCVLYLLLTFSTPVSREQSLQSQSNPLRSLSFIPFTLYYGTTASDKSPLLSLTSDGGFLLGGTTELSGNQDGLVVKTNSLGQTQWVRTIGGTEDDEVESLFELSDGNYVVCLYTKSFPSTKRSVLIVKMDSGGSVLWSRSAEGEDKNRPEYMIATNDGGFLVVAYMENALTTDNDIEAIKFNSDGNIEWVGVYTGADSDLVGGVTESQDGGYFIIGQSYSYGDNSKRAVYILKVSATGQKIWSKLVGGFSANSAGYATVESKDSSKSIYIAGITYAFGVANSYDILVSKLNQNGGLEWVKILGGSGSNTPKKMLAFEDGSVMCLSYTSGYGEGDRDMLLFKLTAAGDLEWARTFGTTATEYAYDFQQLPTGGYVISGYSDGYGAGSYDLVLLTLSEDLESCSNLIQNQIALQMTDITHHADLLFQNMALTENLSYAATIPYNPVSSTVTDISPQLNSVDGKDLCPLMGQSISSASTTVLSNECGCSVYGACNSVGNCDCQGGYSGFACSYSNSHYLSFTTQISSKISSLSGSVGSVTDREIMIDLDILTRTPEVLTFVSASTALQLLQSIITPANSQELRQYALDALSHLSQFSERQEASQSLLGLTISKLMLQLGEHSLDSPTTLSSSAIHFTITPLSASPDDSISITPFSSSTLVIKVPSSIVLPTSSTALIMIENSQSIYAPLKAPSLRPASGIVSLNYYVDKANTPISDLSSPVVIEIPLLTSSPSVKRLIEAVFSSSPTTSKERVISNNQLQCVFYNEASQTLSQHGCSLTDFSSTSVTCTCTHMTDFMAFVSSSLDTLRGSNYSVLSALPSISIGSLRSNYGLFVSLAYWTSFLLFMSLALCADFRAVTKEALGRLIRKKKASLKYESEDAKEKSNIRESSGQYLNSNNVSFFESETVSPVERFRRNSTIVPTLSCPAEQSSPQQQSVSQIKTQRTKQPSFVQSLRSKLFNEFEKSKSKRCGCFCLCF